MLGALVDEAAISVDAMLPHRKAAIALAADLLAPVAGMTYVDAKRALSAREALGSTAVGHGVALPHAMSATCERPAIAVIRLANPIEWRAADHIDVDVVAAILWPDHQDDSFRKFIAELCRLLRKPDILGSIRRAGSAVGIRMVLDQRLPMARAA